MTIKMRHKLRLLEIVGHQGQVFESALQTNFEFVLIEYYSRFLGDIRQSLLSPVRDVFPDYPDKYSREIIRLS